MVSNATDFDVPGARDFDFMVGEWQVHNRFKKPDGSWMEFSAVNRGEKHLDACIIIDHYDSEVTLATGRTLKGITIRAYDFTAHTWSIVWLDNRGKPGFDPMVGTFNDGVGLFYSDWTNAQGNVGRIRFMWDKITDVTARWQQAFSYDDERTWDTNWIMEFSR